MSTILALFLAFQGGPWIEHGLNPSFHGPSSRAVVFADAMLRARALEPAGTRVFSDVELPAGDWVLTWDGAGQAALVGPAPTLAEALPGRSTYRVQPDQTSALFVNWTAGASNVRLWLPFVEGRGVYPNFVRMLRALQPVTLRTLDWTRTNEGWRDRSGDRSYFVIPPAVQVDIANRVGCGLHFQVPHGAPGWWLAQTFGELSLLEGELTLEVSNEMWNPIFPVWRWLDAQPGRVVDAAALEIDRVFAVAEQIVPQARHFVGGQLGNPWWLATLLGLLRSRVDACGPAAYAALRDVPATPELAVAALRARVALMEADVRTHKAIADAFGAELEVYEAGQHFPTGGLVASLAQREPGMGRLYMEISAMLEREGAARVSWYSLMTSQDLPAPAPFGIFEGMGAPLLPKGLAVIQLMRGTTW